MQAFQEIQSNPGNIAKYQDNPKIQRVMEKLSTKFGGDQRPGGPPGGTGGPPDPTENGTQETTAPSDTPPAGDMGLD